MFTYRPNFIPNKVMIIGCGGTGSRLVPLLAQFIKTCAWVPDPEITLIDDDIVEEKNLFRQNFIAPDVGKSKAEVLANRYARAFNINITAIKARVTNYKDYHPTRATTPEIGPAIDRYKSNSIIVLCVDSPQARRDILNILLSLGVGAQGNVLLLDSGNENDFGQVSVSNMMIPSYNKDCDIEKLPNSIPGDIELPYIPMDVSYFRDMQATNTPSCADLDQTMAINTMMAVTMFGIIQNFYYAKPFLYHRINISLSHGATPQYMNTEFIKLCAGRDNDMLEGRYIQSFSVQSPINKFYKEVYKPFQEAIAKAEKAKLDKENELKNPKVVKAKEEEKKIEVSTSSVSVTESIAESIADLAEAFVDLVDF